MHSLWDEVGGAGGGRAKPGTLSREVGGAGAWGSAGFAHYVPEPQAPPPKLQLRGGEMKPFRLPHLVILSLSKIKNSMGRSLALPYLSFTFDFFFV